MKKFRFFLSLFGGLIIALVSIYGFILLSQRPGLPQEVRVENLKQVDDIEIRDPKDMEFVLSQKRIGERSTFYIKVDDRIERREFEFVPYYSQVAFPLIYLLIGLFCFAIGVVVFLLRAEDARARIYYWASVAFSSANIISGGYYCLRKNWLSYIPGVFFYFLYPLAPALLLRFSLFFSKNKAKIPRFIIYFLGFLFAVSLVALFLYSSLKSSIAIYHAYQSAFLVFRAYLVLFILLTIFQFILSYRKAALEEVRAQIKWIFYGLFVGLGPFISIYNLPQLLGKKPLISEELSTVFFIFIPLAFAFSIIKFRLMDIKLVINRSIVYSVLTIFTVGIYLLSVGFLQNVFSRFFIRQTAISLIAAFAAALAFNPARKKIQEFVDKTFFRMSYDYRQSILSFNEIARKMSDSEHLVDFSLLKIKKTLPLEHIGVLVYSTDLGEQKLSIAKDGEKDLGDLATLLMLPGKILARRRAVRTEEDMDFSQERALEARNLELVIPLSFRSEDLSGFLSIGKKKSGERFNRDDLELLLTMAGELALNLERIKLQEEVICERAEKEKLDELNRLKTEFISSVSHELRTPMSSIQGLAEVLLTGKIKEKAKQDELIGLVAGESSRLSRFLHNILDFGKIEQEVKTYNFQKVELQPVIEEAIKPFQYRLESEKFVLKTSFPEAPIFLVIDQDAIRQVLTNLIDNAIKYSSGQKEIEIMIAEKESHIEIQVKDKGIGIPEEAQEKIFKGFYRHEEASRHNPKGVGLGLKIVKHIIEAHKGEIRIKSQPLKGSTFSLIFPKP
jgi:signal transduction histidine kinase